MGSTSFLSEPKKSNSNIIKPRPIISVLPNSYSLLTDKPAINGVELTKDTTLTDLNILSSDGTSYKTITLSIAAEKKLSIPTISDGGEAEKIAVKDIVEAIQIIKTVEELDESARISSYQKVIIKKMEK